LDALALVEAAPIGDTGTLNGAVTDAETGDALAGATVEVVGPIERELVTDEEGGYSALLTAGDYTLSASLFGYGTETAEATVEAGGEVTVDFALEASPSATISGTVTDGSGHGWPLYTKVGVVGTDVSSYTDPATGEYSLDLPSGATYTLEFQAQYPGYETENVEVTVD